MIYKPDDFDKLVNDGGNIPTLVLVLKREGDVLYPVIVENLKALKNARIRNSVARALREWISNLEPAG